MQRAIQRLPQTGEGIPVGFYRIDLLPPPSSTLEEEVEGLQLAYQDLSFEHGYPTLADGRPWWYKMDFEPGFAYGAFQIYLETGKDTPRTLGQLSENEELLRLAAQIYPKDSKESKPNIHVQAQTETQTQTQTQIQIQTQVQKVGSNGSIRYVSKNGGRTKTETHPAPTIAETPGARADIPINSASAISSAISSAMTPSRLSTLLTEFSILYNWKARARAFDLYQDAAYRHRKLRRQSTSEDSHYLMAESLLSRLKREVLETPEFFKDMDPKVALDMLVKLVSIQRISTGLPASGPLAPKDVPEETSFEMIMRTLGRKSSAGVNGNTFDQSGALLGGQDVVDRVLGDKDATTGLQELIIRVTKASHQDYDPLQGTEGRRFRGRRNSRTQEILDSESLEAYDFSDAPGAHE